MRRADKQTVTNSVTNDWLKYNDPNALKTMQGILEQQKNLVTLSSMRQQLEDIGRRFDEDFKDIDDMQKNSTRLGRAITRGGFGIGTTASEKLADDEFNAWKGSMKNVLVNANRQAGSGSMSDADAARYEQDIGNAQNPAQARNILDSFERRMKTGMGITVQTGDGYAF